MTEEEKMILQGFRISMETMGLEILKLKAITITDRNRGEIPEWVTLEKAAALKGGPALATYKCKKFLQPCCGLNSKTIGGRKCWHRDQILKWLSIDDSTLKAYAQEWKVQIPENYELRSA